MIAEYHDGGRIRNVGGSGERSRQLRGPWSCRSPRSRTSTASARASHDEVRRLLRAQRDRLRPVLPAARRLEALDESRAAPARRRSRSSSPGCCSARRRCCRSPERSRSSTCARISQRSRSTRSGWRRGTPRRCARCIGSTGRGQVRRVLPRPRRHGVCGRARRARASTPTLRALRRQARRDRVPVLPGRDPRARAGPLGRIVETCEAQVPQLRDRGRGRRLPAHPGGDGRERCSSTPASDREAAGWVIGASVAGVLAYVIVFAAF